MAKQADVIGGVLRVRPNSFEENRALLREVQSRKEVDARTRADLAELFEVVNTRSRSRRLHLQQQQATTSDSTKQEKTFKEIHYGPVSGVPSGTWWGIRMDCSRDNIHEPFNENIHDGPFGAVSICTSHLNSHNDVDLGNILTFTSREYNTKDQSKDSLILSFKNKVPIRLVRSYCLSNNYAPKTGYRYDGLYTVVHHWIGVSANATKYHKFVFTRVMNQEPAPWSVKKSRLPNILKSKRLTSPRLTRSHCNTSIQEPKNSKLESIKTQKESKVANISSIVSRQVFKKFVPGSPDTSPKSASSTDSFGPSSCSNTCQTKLCNTNLSIRTNLYDSSHNLQETKKAVPMTFCRIFKPNQLLQPQKNSQEEIEKLSTNPSNIEIMDNVQVINNSDNEEGTDRKVKRVTWADSCNSTLTSIGKSAPIAGNGFQYSGSGVVDGFSPTSPKKCSVVKCNNVSEHSFSPILENSQSNSLSPNTNYEHISDIHSTSNAPQTSRQCFSKICESFNETDNFDEPSSSIDSLAPDKLVSVIVKEKYHPMAKLLIGNMIGLENQESAILSAYNTLTSKVDQDDSKKSKENKLRNKFYIRNKSRKNGVLKKQRREIANLMIDAKFDTATRGSTRNCRLRSPRKRISKSEISQRKIINARRIQSRTLNKEIRSTVKELQAQKPEKRKAGETKSSKRPKMITVWTQCSLLPTSSVDQSLQVGDSFTEAMLTEEDMKIEMVDLVEIKSEPCDAESISEEVSSEPDTNYSERNCFSGSAFAAVNTVDSSLRIARLRSIGFKPIRVSPLEDEDLNEESSRPDVDEEYNKYTSEENNIVGYMDEQLHFKDIEEEEIIDTSQSHERMQKKVKKQSLNELLMRPVESLKEHDFHKPWHGWKKTFINGQVYWTGY